MIIQTNNGAPATAQYCQAIKDAYGLTMDVVYDPTGVMTAYGTNDQFVVSDESATITFSQKYASESAVTAAIDANLQ